MTVRVGINGFGRIGRNFFRAALASGGDLDEHGHRDTSVSETPGEHHDHPGHKPGDLDEHGHRDRSASPKP